tara:strand:- start:857 stop:1021 length:165 start_codon:yes stop_codon:yes gene_type:complete
VKIIFLNIYLGLIVGIYGDKPPLMKTKILVKIEEVREIHQRVISQGRVKTKPFW